MIKVYPDFFTEEEFNRIVGSLELDKMHDVPNAYNTKSYHSQTFNVHKKVSQFGKLAFQELLVYSTGAYSEIHVDGLSYAGGPAWIATGILFCNEEYTGGKLCFPKLGIELKPPRNTLIVFPAGVDSHVYEHGVTEVLSGERMTAIFRFKDSHE